MLFFSVLRKEMLEHWRMYRFLIVVVILVSFGILSPITAKFLPEIFMMLPEGEQIAALIPEPTILDAIGQYVKNSGQFIVILALLITSGAVAQEKDKGTAALMLVKPLPRSTFILSKFIALGITFLAGIILSGAACYYYTWFLFEPLVLNLWVLLNVLLFLYTLVYISITLFCSTIFRSQISSAGLAVGFVVIISITGLIPKVSDYLPGRLLDWGMQLFIDGDVIDTWKVLLSSSTLILVLLIAACVIFSQQEL